MLPEMAQMAAQIRPHSKISIVHHSVGQGQSCKVSRCLSYMKMNVNPRWFPVNQALEALRVKNIHEERGNHQRENFLYLLNSTLFPIDKSKCEAKYDPQVAQ